MNITFTFDIKDFDRQKMIDVLTSDYDVEKENAEAMTNDELILEYLNAQIKTGVDYDSIYGLVLVESNVQNNFDRQRMIDVLVTDYGIDQEKADAMTNEKLILEYLNAMEVVENENDTSS